MSKLKSSQGYFNEKMLAILEKGEKKVASKKKTTTTKAKPVPKKKGK